MQFAIEVAIQNVLEDRAQSSPELADQVVAYAKCLPTASDAPEDVLRSRTNAIVSSAMILARDGAGIDQVGLFLPELARLIEEGPVPLPDVDHESSRGFSKASTGRLTDEIGHIDRLTRTPPKQP
jgi:hypothetical protein